MNNQKLVRFVLTPFLPWEQPALGVSNLKAVLSKSNIPADIKYLNIDYLEKIGLPLYDFVCTRVNSAWALGEMIFSNALWEEIDLNWTAYKKKLRNEFLELNYLIELDEESFEKFMEQIDILHEESPRIIAKWANDILEDRPRIIGFSSTFQQNIAALALAKKIREIASYDDLIIIFGGANCEAEMGRALADNFSFIDYVVSGEAENVILPLVTECLNPKKNSAGRYGRFIAGEMVQNLDSLPAPIFSDYFEVINRTEYKKRINLVAESSRGCWWGAKSQCKFCGLNGTHIAYRSKEPKKFSQEIIKLVKEHKVSFVKMADNILDPKYYNRFFPEIVDMEPEINFFYETKSNLSKKQLLLLAAGRVIAIQPGIESLSSAILKMISKGNNFLQNLQLLKWCEELDIMVKWNLLIGFPNESLAALKDMTDIMEFIPHLPPPSGPVKFQLQRFSPYKDCPEKYSINNVRRYWSYDFIYAGLDREERERLAYYFEYGYSNGQDPDSYMKPIIDKTLRWKERYLSTEHTLEVLNDNEKVYITDTRFNQVDKYYLLNSVEQQILMIFDAMHSKDAAFKKLKDSIPAVTYEEFEAIVDSFLERKWILKEDDKYLSIVINRAERTLVDELRTEIYLQKLGIPLFSLFKLINLEAHSEAKA
jgi:ribosomal peptide maturation radical SAM protein 1